MRVFERSGAVCKGLRWPYASTTANITDRLKSWPKAAISPPVKAKQTILSHDDCHPREPCL
ncbi:hypothetical protein [Microvirga massiliensis]|uniref:hypothetical protein n=1 Tax=Microvirga massiliensis TaxID=1033741 RepID=UPI000AACE8B0|nr:hypothetical protein [Microvirga massiliensis]